MLQFALVDMAGFDGGMFWHGGGFAKLKEWNLVMGFCIVGVTLPNNNTRANVLIMIVY
jgi:hypothetical protein